VEQWIEEKDVGELHLYVSAFTPSLTTPFSFWNNRSKWILHQHNRDIGESEVEVWNHG
jgi:hypothetical protein